MSKGQIDAVLNAAALEGQQYREQAKLRTLPPDPAAWLAEYESYADGLPGDLPQKRVMLDHIAQARQHLTGGNMDEAKFYMLQIEENWSNAEHDLWVLRIERGSSSGGTKAATTKQAERNARAQEARDRYDRLTHIPERDRTAVIAREMGLHPRTVRNYLNKTK